MASKGVLFCGVLLCVGLMFGLAGCGTDPSAPATPEPRIWKVPGDWPTLAAAADTAKSGETIELAPGVYREHGIVIQTGVDVRGAEGKAGEVILDGQGLSRILTVAPDTVSEDHTDLTSVLTNLVFRNGRADRFGGGALLVCANTEVLNSRLVGNSSIGPGGAVNSIATDVSFANCLFDSNLADSGSGEGGAVAASAFHTQLISFTNCLFQANVSVSAGGALFLIGPTEITNGTFQDNEALLGGAALLGGSSPTLTDCLFQGNAARPQDGNDGSGFGGALYLSGGDGDIIRCVFKENTGLLGSAAYGFNGSVFVGCEFADNVSSGSGTVRWAGTTSPAFQDCDFLRNEAEYGGAFSTMGGVDLTLASCNLTGNTAGAGGAMIFQDNDQLTLIDCVVTDNASASMGGAFANLGSSNSSAVLEFENCLVSGNTAETSGGAVFLGGVTALTARGTTFSGNTAPEYSGGFIGNISQADLICCTLTDQEFGGQGAVIVEDTNCGK